MIDNLLGIETSQDACSVAVKKGGQVVVKHLTAPRQQAKILLSMIDGVLKEASITLGELDAIAFGCGPGSFTGLRIAAWVAQGLAYAASLPVIHVSSLQTVAQAVFEATGILQVAVAIDARLSEVYWGFYRFDDASGLMVGHDALAAPCEMVFPQKGEYVIAGNAFDIYASLIPVEAEKVKKYTQEARADTLVNIASKQGQSFLPFMGVPHYIRDKVDSMGL